MFDLGSFIFLYEILMKFFQFVEIYKALDIIKVLKMVILPARVRHRCFQMLGIVQICCNISKNFFFLTRLSS